ncbi:hypothetical protein ACVW1C_001036 [Bradyrhizobium sp. USDA 4011]
MRKLLKRLVGPGALADAEYAIVVVIILAIFLWLMKAI